MTTWHCPTCRRPLDMHGACRPCGYMAGDLGTRPPATVAVAMRCPRCGASVGRQGPGWWRCPACGMELLAPDREAAGEVPEEAGGEARAPGWPPTSEEIRAVMAEDMARGQRKGGGGGRRRGKSPQREKLDSWLRRRRAGEW